MKMKKHVMLLAVPIIILFSWTFYHDYSSRVGEEIYLPVEGYDPRDLLSGHYLTYQVSYGNFDEEQCSYKKASRHDGVVYMCLDNGVISTSVPEDCGVYIKGRCRAWGMNRFEAGIERFYVPENKAIELDRLLRSGEYEAAIKVFVTKDGRAYVKEFFLDGMAWRDFMEREERLGTQEVSPEGGIDDEAVFEEGASPGSGGAVEIEILEEDSAIEVPDEEEVDLSIIEEE